MSKDTGGPAFPKLTQDERWKTFRSTDGMTLRDYFAAKAMQALLSRGGTKPGEITQAAYLMADFMLKERNE